MICRMCGKKSPYYYVQDTYGEEWLDDGFCSLNCMKKDAFFQEMLDDLRNLLLDLSPDKQAILAKLLLDTPDHYLDHICEEVGLEIDDAIRYVPHP